MLHAAMVTTKKTKRAPPLHFFQIILQDTLQSGKLVLPKRFSRMYGEKLSDVVSLKVPTGDVWEMELRRCNDDTVRFEKKGWLDFTRFYSLEFGSLLMFRYVEVEPSKFQVLIFDKSTMEINYPKMKSIQIIQVSDGDGDDDDDDDDDDGSMSIMSEWSDHPSLPSTPPSKKRMKFSTGKAASCSRLGKAKYRDMGGYNNSDVHIQLRPSGKVEVRPLSKSFNSVHPYFARIMQPSYGHPPHKLVCCSCLGFLDSGNLYVQKVPSKFLRKYIPKENAGELKLCTSSNGTSRPNSGFVSKYPFFQVPIHESYLLHNTLSIPYSFMESNLKMESKEQILTFKTEGGGSWPVKLHAYPPYPSNVNKMCGGLAAFFRGNSVEVGDFCTFELIDKEQKVFIVTISRAAHS